MDNEYFIKKNSAFVENHLWEAYEDDFPLKNQVKNTKPNQSLGDYFLKGKFEEILG
jgi:hypothetical protein